MDALWVDAGDRRDFGCDAWTGDFNAQRIHGRVVCAVLCWLGWLGLAGLGLGGLRCAAPRDWTFGAPPRPTPVTRNSCPADLEFPLEDMMLVQWFETPESSTVQWQLPAKQPSSSQRSNQPSRQRSRPSSSRLAGPLDCNGSMSGGQSAPAGALSSCQGMGWSLPRRWSGRWRLHQTTSWIRMDSSDCTCSMIWWTTSMPGQRWSTGGGGRRRRRSASDVWTTHVPYV